MKLLKFWFTWGFGQGHDNCYTVIEAPDPVYARLLMLALWGKRWCGQYATAEAAGVYEHDLRHIPTDRATIF